MRRQRIADGVVDLVALRAAVGGDHALALLEEEARGEHRLVQQAAAVAAQVEHQPLGALAVEPLDRMGQLAVGALLKVAKRT